jgi:sodium-dependent dicarboxylate transporter 2/3/5
VLDLPWFASFGRLVATKEWLVRHIPEASASLIATVLLFVLPVEWDLKQSRVRFTLTWSDAVRIDWGTILLFGAGISLGGLMFDTGVAKALGDTLTAQLGLSSLWTLTALSIALAIVLSEATSNTAAATMMVPTVVALARTTGVDPLPPALGACIGASFGFMLPVSTAPNAIVYGSGLVSIPSMIRAGVLFDVLGFGIIFVGLRVLYPLLELAK